MTNLRHTVSQQLTANHMRVPRGFDGAQGAFGFDYLEDHTLGSILVSHNGEGDGVFQLPWRKW